MNIHFDDKKVLEELENNSIGTFLVGSKMYGTDTENSDTDTLTIYVDYNYSYYWEHHQLQYKGLNEDKNFTELRTFIRNLLTGDSTINLEILFSDNKINPEIEFLKEFKYNFINFNIIRSYIGMANRDLKKFNSTKINKKLAHSFRGYIFAESLMTNKDLDIKMNTKIYNGIDLDRDIYMKILSGEETKNKNSVKYSLKSQIQDQREKLNEMFNKKEIHRMMSIEKLKELDENIKNFYKNNIGKYSEIDYKNIFYEVLENGVTY